MKLVPVKQAQAKLFNARADKGLQSLTLLTFKKDRSLTLRRDEGGEGWTLAEDGFLTESTAVPAGAAGKRLLKDAFNREFPRSANAYLAEVRRSA